MRSLRLTAVVALAAGSVTASVALASTASAAQDSLTLTLTKEFEAPKTVTLECEPTGGTHPDAAAACADLIAANGQIDRIPRVPGAVCAADYDPTTASASGFWRGQVIDYSKEFPNPCLANVEAGGHVFHF